MDKKDINELTVIKESIFCKIKKLFKNLFSKEHKELNITEVKKENNFLSRLKIEEDNEEKRLLKLQSLIAEDVITEDELPKEDVIELHKLYDKQILDLKKEIDEYREKILKLRMNING